MERTNSDSFVQVHLANEREQADEALGVRGIVTHADICRSLMYEPL
jgi:hypothetical protein